MKNLILTLMLIFSSIVWSAELPNFKYGTDELIVFENDTNENIWVDFFECPVGVDHDCMVNHQFSIGVDVKTTRVTDCPNSKYLSITIEGKTSEKIGIQKLHVYTVTKDITGKPVISSKQLTNDYAKKEGHEFSIDSRYNFHTWANFFETR